MHQWSVHRGTGHESSIPLDGEVWDLPHQHQTRPEAGENKVCFCRAGLVGGTGWQGYCIIDLSISKIVWEDKEKSQKLEIVVL